MDEQVFWIKLREIIKEEITTAIQSYLNPVGPPEEENMISPAELCSQLKISKPYASQLARATSY